MKKLIFMLLLVLIVIGGSSQVCMGGVYWPSYYGIDAYTTWQTYTVSYQTGYWNGWYPYAYGGYNWAPYQGWGYIAPSPYYTRYGLNWAGPSWYYGFTDYFTASVTVPRTVFTWSRYWDDAVPSGPVPGNTLDIYSVGNDATGQASPLSSSIMSEVTMGDHYFSINGGYDEGTFTPLVWVSATAPAIQSYLGTLGLDSATIASIMGDQVILDLIANNTGNDVLGLQYASYITPEPATLALLSLGGLALLRRKR